jgi:type IX secretion system PorP/SprF family membrane protein
MKKIITSVLFFVAATAYSQVNSPWTQYYQTPYMQNPALSGIENYTDIKLGYKRQWTSFEGAPKDYFLSLSHAFGKPATDSVASAQKKMGLSAYVANSDFNLVNNLQGGAAYAVHIPVSSQYSLSFGLAATFSQSKIKTNQLIARDEQDPKYLSVMNAGGALRYFNIDAGAMIYSRRFYAGYSAIRMIRTRLGSELPGDGKSAMRHTLLVGYNHPLNADWELQPSVLVRMENGLDNIYNVNVKARYRSMLWAGVSCAVDRSISILAGYQFRHNLTFGYSYDFNTGKISTNSPGSHEIVLGFMPFNKTKQKAFFW